MTDEITLDAPETPLERFLAAAAGVEGITLDEPVTRIEKYLYKIAQGGGSGGGAYLVHYDSDTGALDKTWDEINAALASGIVEIVIASDEEFGTTVEYVRETGHNKISGYYVEGANMAFYADDPDGYPVYDAGSEA